MPTRNLSKIFEPSSIVIIGSTASDISIATTAYRNIKSGGFGRPVWVVDEQYSGTNSSSRESSDVIPMDITSDTTISIDPHFVLPTLDALTWPMPELAIVACADASDIPPIIRSVATWASVASSSSRGAQCDHGRRYGTAEPASWRIWPCVWTMRSNGNVGASMG